MELRAAEDRTQQMTMTLSIAKTGSPRRYGRFRNEI
jgi:hypothetical protein